MATKEESKPYAAPAAYPKEADNAEMLSTLNIIAFDIGQGDSTLVISPEGEAVLIDTGPYGSWNSKISPYLTENPQINLEYLIITHSDNDHDGDVEASGLEPYAVSAGDVINLGENVYLSILAADCAFTDGSKAACDEKDDNAHSTVILIEYGNFKYLTTGDLPGGGGKPPYDTIDLETKIGELAGDVDILHAGHHGSTTSTNQNLLNAAAPEAAIISVGNNNDYWQPHPSVMERLIAAGIHIYQTERGWLKDEFLDSVHIAGANIIIESDGVDYKIEY